MKNAFGSKFPRKPNFKEEYRYLGGKKTEREAEHLSKGLHGIWMESLPRKYKE